MQAASSKKATQLLSNTFTIIIPAYNEEMRIGPVLDEICDFISKNGLEWKVVVSIDGDDRTEEIVSSYARNYPFVSGNKSTSRGGKGMALKRALREVRSDYVITMDADRSVAFTDIVPGLSNLKENEVLIFSRYSKENHIPAFRRLLSRGYNLLLRALLRIKVRDTQSGYIASKSQPFINAMNKVGVTNGFYYAILYYYLARGGSKIMEVPIKYNHREGSKFNPLGMVIGGGVSLIAFLLRHSRFYKHVPKPIIELYNRKFRWI
jgi:glycosyltransferase involved in cell wall biosynthesis